MTRDNVHRLVMTSNELETLPRLSEHYVSLGIAEQTKFYKFVLGICFVQTNLLKLEACIYLDVFVTVLDCVIMYLCFVASLQLNFALHVDSRRNSVYSKILLQQHQEVLHWSVD